MSIKTILGFITISLLLFIVHKQDEFINEKRSEITLLKAQKDSLLKAYDSLYSDHWTLKTYIELKEGRAEE